MYSIIIYSYSRYLVMFEQLAVTVNVLLFLSDWHYTHISTQYNYNQVRAVYRLTYIYNMY